MNNPTIPTPSKPEHPVDPTRRYATLTFMRGAIVSLVLTILAGVYAASYYLIEGNTAGIGFTSLRPLHTTFATAWIFLGGMAITHHYFQSIPTKVDLLERWLLRGQVLLWGFSGAGILITLIMGISSGREYMGFSPYFSIPILLGWLCFVVNFFRHTRHGFMSQPIYVTMWGISALFFIYTFSEQHLYLLPGIFSDPIADIRIQWKACGTTVGSYNLFVYAALYYVGEKLSGDKSYAHSNLAYSLFFVGLINSFTNFAHHTYHVPQSKAVVWISFVISMIEIILLARVMVDLTRAVKKAQPTDFHGVRFFMSAAKWWTMIMLGSSVLISIPPLNSLIHGTRAIPAHAMGATIGIDSMALLGALIWLLVYEFKVKNLITNRSLRLGAIGFNVATAILVIVLHIIGVAEGYYRYLDLPEPDWFSESSPWMFAIGGFAAAIFAGIVLLKLAPPLLQRLDNHELSD